MSAPEAINPAVTNLAELTASERRVRLLVDDAAAGAWNMAVDEALLEAASEGGPLILRFYRWQEATLSLGYFQAHAERAGHEASRDCPLVRRQTGGGAIVHDRELTYSLCVPPAHPWANETQALYEQLHGSLISLLGERGVTARLCAAASGLSKAEEPFLCFQRRAVGDLLCGPAKIGGSAQRRSQRAVLQHGSLLLAQSPHAPELPGITELTGRQIDAAELVTRWQRNLEERLGLELQASQLQAKEAQRAKHLLAEKYGSDHWTLRR